MKFLPFAAAVILAVFSVFLGMNGHPVLAGIGGYFAVSILVVIVVHNSSRSAKRLVALTDEISWGVNIPHVPAIDRHPIPSNANEALAKLVHERGLRPATIDDLSAWGRNS